MKKKLIPPSLICILLVVTAVFIAGCGSGTENVSSQQWTTQAGGTVKGKIVSSDSLEPLSGITVSIGDQAAATDDSGNYVFYKVTAGAALLKAEGSGFDTARESVQVAEGQTTTADISMDSNASDWLSYGTSYRWQVEVVHDDGTVTEGPQWSFTTESLGKRALPKPVITKGIDESSARTVARAFISTRQGFSLESCEPVNDKSGVTFAYAFILSPRGYVIVPAIRLDVVPPVLAYSFDSTFSPGTGGPNMLSRMVVLDLKTRLGAFARGISFSSREGQKNRILWERYLAGKAEAVQGQRTVWGPLLKSAWHQYAPYNNKCPEDPVANASGTKSRCLVGCVATAFSEVFNYYQVPNSITLTSEDNYVTKTRKIAINAPDANFSALNYNNGSPDDDAKAKLCFASGVYVRMDYSKSGSYAGIFTFGKSIQYCGYNAAKDKRYEVNEESLYDPAPMIADIKASRPCVMLIRKVKESGDWGGGHAVAIDGYNDSDETLHVNFGWRDTTWNAWYSLPKDSPSGYTAIRGYVYNIIPIAKGQKQAASRATTPQNPFPRDNETAAAIDEELEWDDCDDATSYNCYVWKAGEQKPSIPTFKGLRAAAADSNYLSQ